MSSKSYCEIFKELFILTKFKQWFMYYFQFINRQKIIIKKQYEKKTSDYNILYDIQNDEDSPVWF